MADKNHDIDDNNADRMTRNNSVFSYEHVTAQEAFSIRLSVHSESKIAKMPQLSVWMGIVRPCASVPNDIVS